MLRVRARYFPLSIWSSPLHWSCSGRNFMLGGTPSDRTCLEPGHVRVTRCINSRENPPRSGFEWQAGRRAAFWFRIRSFAGPLPSAAAAQVSPSRKPVPEPRVAPPIAGRYPRACLACCKSIDSQTVTLVRAGSSAAIDGRLDSYDGSGRRLRPWCPAGVAVGCGAVVCRGAAGLRRAGRRCAEGAWGRCFYDAVTL
jgi:hypothetical protein